jgi:hypothetical protein
MSAQVPSDPDHARRSITIRVDGVTFANRFHSAIALEVRMIPGHPAQLPNGGISARALHSSKAAWAISVAAPRERAGGRT